ncbi:tripartite tricarboxylate transporter TctB family protein [Jeotgalibacillus proteolyticus]|uniref:DUF1468 domain-containing protein n=1 Tax=Jeotgalibacillus proteolyticus TaxID=2082395 RepID=A0A2S5G875_9BACL|nr:tripartite tricarboxylate transporter TctB family protein [Jeotgalibacillus proteolyticus]PPA69121.1 hypothetical protein C4B60_17575 [Jeotgalibacillus proteolyticus]
MTKQTLNVIFTTCLFITFTWAAVSALAFSRLAQFFPLYVSIIGSIVSGIYLATEIFKLVKQKEKVEQSRVLILKPLIYTCWVAGYIGIIYLAGLFLATAIYLVAFLLIESKFSLFKAVYSTGIALVIMTVVSNLLKIAWPQGLIGI